MKKVNIILLALLLKISISQIYRGKPAFIPVQNQIPLSPVWDSSLQPPYPTNTFFQNLVAGSGNQPINLFPYLVRIERNSQGLGISATTKNEATQFTVATHFDLDWAVTPHSGIFDSHKIVRYDQLSVTVKSSYKQGSMIFPLFRGSAYISIIVEDLAPILYTARGITNVTDGKGSQVEKLGTSDEFIITLGDGKVWVLYGSEDMQIMRTSNQIRFQAPVNGIMRLAYIGEDRSKLPIYSKYKDAVPTRGHFVNGGMNLPGHFRFGFNCTFMSRIADQKQCTPLIFALPHHLEVLVNPVVENVTLNSIKGKLTAVGNSNWTIQEQLPNISWEEVEPEINPLLKETTKAALIQDLNLYADQAVPPQVAVYNLGVQVMRLARLALIADQLNEQASAIKARQAIKRFLIPCLDSSNSNMLFYDTTYGGIIADLQVKDKVENSINKQYDNHHHEYGYLIYAAAVVAKKDKAFLKLYSWQIDSLVRDYANPYQRDNYLPFARHKDWYLGHSWSSGLVEYTDNRYEESISEAINAYYAVALLGKAMKNKYLENWGRLLVATELRSAKKYWQMRDDTVYPAIFAQNRMVGVMWSTKADYRSQLGPEGEYIHGLNMLPFTPLTTELLSQQFIKTEYPVFNSIEANGEWQTYQIMAQAVIDPTEAWIRATITSVTDFGRNSRTNMLWWIMTRKNIDISKIEEMMQNNEMQNDGKGPGLRREEEESDL